MTIYMRCVKFAQKGILSVEDGEACLDPALAADLTASTASNMPSHTFYLIRYAYLVIRCLSQIYEVLREHSSVGFMAPRMLPL